jgi:hypothetical protein
MPVIRTIVDDETYASLTRKRKREGMPSVSALFLKKCDELTDEREAGEIVRQALRQAAKQDPNERFKLQDLFPARRWQAFNKGARLRAGRMFKAKVDTARHGLRAVAKSSSNHQYYVRSN